ncbi:H-2 class I histocompatibility antigen, Q10 alpha chain-like [Triplophysa rosa]|uniref:H-2 class I histocompatibility antigen, Q10 alpha chain-like n=1 Tax=Triplophysa rosa TaxID=992332 RepID=UPI002545CFC9|nr:H-2 class I histocompatibility antigen, Q10 alpha chain-like [Triplophysa rosa]
MRSLALLLFGIHLAFAGTHSLQYFCTTVFRDMNIEKYIVVGIIDDLQFMHFDSDTMKAEPKTDWMRKNEGADYWNVRTQTVIGHYQEYRNFMQIVMHLYNQSMSGVNAFQMMYGCELDDDGTTRGYLQYGYNREDFISFDKNTLTWTAANPQADILKNQWDTDGAKTKYWKAYLESTCFERMKKIVNYGKDTLERNVPPVMSLLQKNSSSPVICHATGFYPKNITMTWKKNHEDLNEDVEVSETLPNADGTFQKSISLSVKSEEWKKNPDVYRCVIQHVGAEKDIVVLLNENNIKSNSASDNTIVKCLVITTVVIAVLAATVFAVKKKLIVCRKCREVNSSNLTGNVKDSTASEISDEPQQNAK